ncbi:MAG: ABC transporter ATP-binding protein [Lachnospiraceae bacterium]|jgi:NitT/TauT family transport system ATP-binding protein|uniref:ABC transporter ATP-binding protein n=1 Tax=Candidatus Merdisoma sp. JLR.KK011 TaxID=3114299 RepID=UPI0029DB525C|nr:ABC transporter ATP-binding protein [Lachnospiraceae bacterium]MCI9479619.1 ABC transporter ATP-binding protein [Lachnospiraceae bacterium]MCI9622688.1 ABC transporter ATP-binding protein [Lachnospiraceae bacterium]
MNPLLELSHVSYSYHEVNGETLALSDISFQLESGSFLAIVGPSGCGKSTLLSLISGLLEPEEGTISFLGKSLREAGSNIGYMLQKDHLFEWRTVYSNVTLGLEIQKKLTPRHLASVDAMLETYGLSSFRDARPSQLSGGMRQRAALIRTLALEPDLLLLDEPFSALDYQTRLSVCDDIAAIIKKEEKTAILVTHDLSEAISMADQVLVLSKRPGRVQRLVPVAFAMEERTPMRSRNAPEFKDYFNLIWKELNISG